MTRKHSNPILDNPDNGGIHSIRRLKSVQTMMTSHGLSKPVVYQFILSGSTRKEYQATIKALVRHIRTKCRAEYLGAYEIGDEKGGEHAHAYFIVETLQHFPGDLLNVTEGHWIARRIARTGMSIRIEAPKAPMHRGAMFAKMNTADKLADVIAWVEYHVKGRSKDAVPDREIYFASEFASNARKREAKRQKYRDAVLKSSRPAPQAIPFLPVDCSTGKGNQTQSEKASHEEITTPQCGTEGQSTGTSQSTDTSPGNRKTTSRSNRGPVEDYGPSHISPGCSRHSSPGAEAIHPGCQDDGPADWKPEAVQRGQSNRRASSQGCDTRQPITHSAGGTTMLTTAQKYIASRYEQAVGLRLDTDEVRAYLLAHGIPRTPAQVVFDLDETYGFYGYASSHPAPAKLSTAVMDRMIDRMSDREIKRLPIPTA
jgi:hypothetical protein